jgi:hypothetical protein
MYLDKKDSELILTIRNLDVKNSDLDLFYDKITTLEITGSHGNG